MWRSAPITPRMCKRLEAIQSACLRMISGAFRTSPVLALRTDTNLPALADRRLLLLVRYYYRAKVAGNSLAVAAMEAQKPQTRRPLRRSVFLPDTIEQAHQSLDVPEVEVVYNRPPIPSWIYHDLSIIYLIDDRK